MLSAICFSALCLTGVTVDGGLGYNSEVQKIDGVTYLADNASNVYGTLLGDISLKAKFNDTYYAKVTHVSGINEAELDWGLNYIGVGAYSDINNFTISMGGAYQFGESTTNNYGTLMVDAEVMYKIYNGAYIAYKMVIGQDGNSYTSTIVGMSADF